jgi:hypothetical protein
MEPRAQQPRPSSNSPTRVLNLSSMEGREVPQTSTDTQYPSMITASTCTHGFNNTLKPGEGAQGQPFSFLGNVWPITVSPEPNAFNLRTKLLISELWCYFLLIFSYSLCLTGHPINSFRWKATLNSSCHFLLLILLLHLQWLLQGLGPHRHWWQWSSPQPIGVTFKFCLNPPTKMQSKRGKA